jgi:colanic acid biosynthesis protein WcaH
MTNLKQAINIIAKEIGDPRRGLSEEVFLLVSSITPLVNVDLLIKNEKNQTLLTWRDDGQEKAGWHIPGGIIRFKEKIGERIRAVARTELGTDVEFQDAPLAINEMFHPVRRERGHFLSFLYQCRLLAEPDERLRYHFGEPQPDQWLWHDSCPEDIISSHEIYRDFI